MGQSAAIASIESSLVNVGRPERGRYREICGPYCTLAIVEILAGRRTGMVEPLAPARLGALAPARTAGLDAEAAIAAAGRHGVVVGQR